MVKECLKGVRRMMTRPGLGLQAFCVALLTAFALAVPYASAGSQSFTRTTSAAVMTTPAQQTVKSTVHYQASLDLACKAAECAGSFPPAPSNTRLRIARVNCYLRAAPGSKFRIGYIQLAGNGTPAVDPKMRWWLPAASISDNGIILINTGVGVEALAGQYLQITLMINGSTGVVSANCAIDGTEYQLQ